MRRTVSRFPQFRPRASAMRIALLQAGLLFAIAPLAYAVDQHEASPIGGKQGGKRVASLPKTVVQGQADDGYAVREVSVIKTATPLINVAQSISVISPIASEAGTLLSLNVNADLAASALAAELKASKLVYLSDVLGLMRDPADE